MSVFDKFPKPAAASFLGWELISEDPAQGRIEIAFHPSKETLNPHGNVQGGMVAAMLDDTMGPALLSFTRGKFIASSIDLNISFIRPVKPARVIARGRVVNHGRSVAFLEAELFDDAGKLLAKATSSAIAIEV